MSQAEFENTTPAFFHYRLQFINRTKEAENGWREYQEREAWERTRLQTWYLVQIQLEKKDRQEITRFLPFPWDPKKTTPDRQAVIEAVKAAPYFSEKIEEHPAEKASPQEMENSFLELLKEAK